MIDKTKVVGVTFDNRQPVIQNINTMVDEIVTIREPDNPHDPNAIGVYVKKSTGETFSVGYINRGLAAKLAPKIDAGKQLIIHDYFITGGYAEDMIRGIIFEYSIEE
jgi:hypothetical protein